MHQIGLRTECNRILTFLQTRFFHFIEKYSVMWMILLCTAFKGLALYFLLSSLVFHYWLWLVSINQNLVWLYEKLTEVQAHCMGSMKKMFSWISLTDMVNNLGYIITIINFKFFIYWSRRNKATGLNEPKCSPWCDLPKTQNDNFVRCYVMFLTLINYWIWRS